LFFQTAERPCHFSSKLLETLREIFDGKTVSLAFRLAVDHLPSRVQSVLKIVSLIPVGYLTTYRAISRVVGRSPRFVGRAIASNPFILLVPCHRVVQSNFSIGGFALGKEIKLGLLQRENRAFKESVSLSIEGKVLPIFPVKTLKKMKTAESSSFV
jgi:methylated-DNA-[protein]-cysteine S-methyltransferase